MGKTDPIAEERLVRLAARLNRRALAYFALAAGVVVIGYALVVVALFYVRASTPMALLLRVHAAGLFGLVAVCWGAALMDKALMTRQSVRHVRDLLLPRGDYHRAFAVLLSHR